MGTLDNLNIDFLILDNTAFVSKLDIPLFSQVHPKTKILITPDVLDEASVNPRSMQTIEIAQIQKILEIREPSIDSIILVKKKAKSTGDLGALSETDINLIALYLDIFKENDDSDIFLMSDDYSIQNVCSQFLPSISILKFTKEGIKEAIIWEIYCPSCFRTYSPSLLGEKCKICDVKIKRKRLSK